MGVVEVGVLRRWPSHSGLPVLCLGAMVEGVGVLRAPFYQVLVELGVLGVLGVLLVLSLLVVEVGVVAPWVQQAVQGLLSLVLPLMGLTLMAPRGQQAQGWNCWAHWPPRLHLEQ